MKLSLFSFMLASIILLSGCGSTSSSPISTEQPVEPINPTEVTTKATGVAMCDNYLTAIQCIAGYSTGTEKSNFNASYLSLVQSFQNVPASQLVETCTTLSNALRSHPTLLKDHPDCNKL